MNNLFTIVQLISADGWRHISARTAANVAAVVLRGDRSSSIDQSGTFNLGDRTVKRLGYGAMQLGGPGVFGPPKRRDAALAVLRGGEWR
jgi:hypothetical protein